MTQTIPLADYRAEKGLTLAAMAVELGLKPSCRGWLSEIENGKKDASVRLAVRIERWSGGRVTADSVCAELMRDHAGADNFEGHGGGSGVDDATLAPTAELGAGKTRENISRTAVTA